MATADGHVVVPTRPQQLVPVWVAVAIAGAEGCPGHLFGGACIVVVHTSWHR